MALFVLLKHRIFKGLQLLLRARVDDYLDWIDVAGLKVFVMDRTEFLTRDTPGISIGPGELATVNVKKVGIFPQFYLYLLHLLHLYLLLNFCSLFFKLSYANFLQVCTLIHGYWRNNDHFNCIQT